MKWQGRRGSNNVEDRRGSGSSGSGMAIGGGGVGLLAIVVIGYFLGIDLTPLLNGQGGAPVGGGGELTAQDQEAGEFVSVVLADTEQVWTQVFQEQLGQTYTPATLVLFSGATQSGCGGASAASGPFYCPADKKVYLDTDFFALMESQLGAGGDFAQAYVVAHEIGHHVQDELGILAEAMNAAERIGDDTLQRQQTGTVRPDSFTHGTSEQRQRWFDAGFDGGTGACDTFAVSGAEL